MYPVVYLIHRQKLMWHVPVTTVSGEKIKSQNLHLQLKFRLVTPTYCIMYSKVCSLFSCLYEWVISQELELGFIL